MSKNDKREEPATPEVIDKETTTAVATRPDADVALHRPTGGALAIPDDAVGLSGHFGPQDMSTPICSLVQPMSQNKGEEGRFSFPDGRSLERLSVVVLNAVATRALWADVSEQIQGPLCRSTDRDKGVTKYAPRVFGTTGGGNGDGADVSMPCVQCPHYNDFKDYTPGKKDLCRYGYTLMLYEVEHQFPFIYFVKGMAFRPVQRRIITPTVLRLQQMAREPDPEKRLALAVANGPWATVLEFTPRKVEEPGKKYWVPDIVPIEETPDEERLRFYEMSLELAGRAEAQTMEDAEAAPEEQANLFDGEPPREE